MAIPRETRYWGSCFSLIRFYELPIDHNERNKWAKVHLVKMRFAIVAILYEYYIIYLRGSWDETKEKVADGDEKVAEDIEGEVKWVRSMRGWGERRRGLIVWRGRERQEKEEWKSEREKLTKREREGPVEEKHFRMRLRLFLVGRPISSYFYNGRRRWSRRVVPSHCGHCMPLSTS